MNLLHENDGRRVEGRVWDGTFHLKRFSVEGWGIRDAEKVRQPVLGVVRGAGARETRAQSRICWISHFNAFWL